MHLLLPDEGLSIGAHAGKARASDEAAVNKLGGLMMGPGVGARVGLKPCDWIRPAAVCLLISCPGVLMSAGFSGL